MSETTTPRNDNLTARMAGANDAEHLIALDVLSRQLETELSAMTADRDRARQANEVNSAGYLACADQRQAAERQLAAALDAVKRRDADCKTYRDGFLAAMAWYACDQDEIERLSMAVSDSIKRGILGEANGAEEHRQLKVMWNTFEKTKLEG